jgi:hypothetical protein
MSDNKPKHGGKRAGAGRKKHPDTIEAEIARDAAAEVKKIAGDHSSNAVIMLAEIMSNPEAHPSARIAAAREILDRGVGKPKQQTEIEHKGNVDLTHILDRIRAKGVNLNDID